MERVREGGREEEEMGGEEESIIRERVSDTVWVRERERE